MQYRLSPKDVEMQLSAGAQSFKTFFKLRADQIESDHSFKLHIAPKR